MREVEMGVPLSVIAEHCETDVSVALRMNCVKCLKGCNLKWSMGSKVKAWNACDGPE